MGQEVYPLVKKLFEAIIPARTLEQKARRIENATIESCRRATKNGDKGAGRGLPNNPFLARFNLN